MKPGAVNALHAGGPCEGLRSARRTRRRAEARKTPTPCAPSCPSLPTRSRREQPHASCTWLRASVAEEAPSGGPGVDERSKVKQELFSALVGSQRGARGDLESKAIVEELQTRLEKVAEPFDITSLEGKWKLCYTTSADLLPLLLLDGLSGFTSIGDIYQKFEKPVDGEGKVLNIISGGVEPFLEKFTGATITVSANYRIESDARVTLAFEEAEVSNIQLNDLAKTILAPAILPRGFPNMRILQTISQLDVKAPLRNPIADTIRGSVGRPTLLITYLDADLLIGRSIPGSGVYIMEKSPDEMPEGVADEA